MSSASGDATATALRSQSLSDDAGVPAKARRRGRRRVALDLSLLALVGVLLVAALGAAGTVAYRELYSPTAFVLRYLDLLSDGRAADALAVAGVTVDSAELEAAGMPATASEALLRRAALAPLSAITVTDEVPTETGAQVTVTYRAGAVAGKTTFEVERSGWIGPLPTWRFAESPLAVVDLDVRGSMEFAVNGFALDKRQVSPDGVEADPLSPISLLVFSPGLYSVSVDTAISETPGVAVLSDSPMTQTPVTVQATATEGFRALVQEKVEEFLTTCATQDVLQPTGCPFGYRVQDRIVSPPTWTIAQQPTVSVEPDGAGWMIPQTEAVARIEVDIRSLFDGSVDQVTEDVPFVVTGSIEILPDGSASIRVSGVDPL